VFRLLTVKSLNKKLRRLRRYIDRTMSITACCSR
jgi:hypothetical protein